MAISNISATFSFQVNVGVTNTNTDNTTVDTYSYGQGGVLPYSQAPPYNGSGGSGNFKLSYHTRLTITAAGNSTLTLSALTDIFGNTIAFTKLKVVLIRITDPATGDYLTYGNGSQPWQGPLSTAANTFKINSILFWENLIDGWSVNSGDVLKLVNSGSATHHVDVFLAGE